MHKFFVDYMLNANLGMICNAHVVHADRSLRKARDPKCLLLAMEASKAVDFPKTGVPGVMPRELRATEYPDFMAKRDKDSYKSESVQGHMYRRVLGAAKGPGGFWESYYTQTGSSQSSSTTGDSDSHSTSGSSVGASSDSTVSGEGEAEGIGGEWRRGRGPQRMLGPAVYQVVQAYNRCLVEGVEFEVHLEEARQSKAAYDRWILDIMAGVSAPGWYSTVQCRTVMFRAILWLDECWVLSVKGVARA